MCNSLTYYIVQHFSRRIKEMYIDDDLMHLKSVRCVVGASISSLTWLDLQNGVLTFKNWGVGGGWGGGWGGGGWAMSDCNDRLK